MESYDLPSTENLSPKQAEQSLKKISADVLGDKAHPYVNRRHPQHKDFNSAVAKLHKTKCKDELPPLEKAMQAGLDRQGEKQNKLVAEAVKEMDKLEELGFDRIAVPDDIQQYQLDSWRMQRLTAERNFEGLKPLLEKQLRNLKVPADTFALFQTFGQAESLDPGLREEIAEKIITWIHKANKQKYGKNGDK